MKTLSTIFGSGVAIRNALYDSRVLRVRKLSRPVVSIGNISVGGSGKTPFVIALGELLKERGITFDVLSRGYGRRSAATSVVDPQGSPELFGDEPLLIAHKLQRPVIVGADRYRAGVLAEEKFDSKLHLLDDGFQHRRLHRDFDIVMLPPDDLQDALLPLGRLREPLSSLRRADAVVLTSSDPRDAEMARRYLSSAEKLCTARRVLKVEPPSGKVVAFCGIARPEQFFSQLRSQNIELAGQISFRDHHHYTQADVERLLKTRADSGAKAFVTTEKDRINLAVLARQLEPLHVATLRMVLDGPGLLDIMLNTLEQRCGCRL
jgi:tetraacyldisaccharide 4'-kinase